MQKTLFYLQEKEVPLCLDFEPYSYGPFSRQVMETASELQKAGVISVGKTEYIPDPKVFDLLPDDKRQKIDALLIVVAQDKESGKCFVVTAYRPDRDKWSEDFRSRRQ